MFLVGLISWWYGRGWVGQWRRMTLRFKATLDFFSVGQLLSTLFSPFRQISATGSNGTGFGAAMRNMLDKLISRVIGAIVRTMTILAGVVIILLQAVYEAVLIVGWWFVPILPIAGLVLFAIGWVPVWR
jgi:hypothetical protein